MFCNRLHHHPSSVVADSLTSAPLYYRGQKALQAEIQVLKKRQSDDPFISGLRDFQEELARLKSIQLDGEYLHAVTFDRAAYPPEQSIKPKRKLIVVLGAVFGLMLGVFFAFFLNFLQNQREDSDQVTT